MPNKPQKSPQKSRPKSTKKSPQKSLYQRLITASPTLARLQDWTVTLGAHKHAKPWLYALAFLEAIIFPIPIDPLYAAIVMARPQNYIRIAIIIGIISTAGGVVGWTLGYAIGEAVQSWHFISQDKFAAATQAFAKHGWLLVLIGAFTPLPYKVMAVSAGFIGIGIIPMILASLGGRIARFVLVGAIVRYRYDNKKATIFTCILVGLIIVFWSAVQ